MTSYLLDTNHLSPLVTESNPLQRKILASVEQGAHFAICILILTEFLFGSGTLPRATQNLAEWQQLSALFPCHLLNEEDATLAAELQISLRRRGWQLATVDALIAAVALRQDLVLLTTDKDFLAVPGLQLENWVMLP